MTTPFKSGYALGIRVSEPGGRLRYAHGGGIQGFNTSLVYFPALVSGKLSGGIQQASCLQ